MPTSQSLQRSGRHARWLLLAVGLALRVEFLLRRRVALHVIADGLGIELVVDGKLDSDSRVALSARDLDVLRLVNLVYGLAPGDGYCLRVALVAGRLLRYRRPQLALGVKRGQRGEIKAHAWLVIGGVALDPEAADFTPLAV